VFGREISLFLKQQQKSVEYPDFHTSRASHATKHRDITTHAVVNAIDAGEPPLKLIPL
jgi:5,10-methylene-tetrahydrofolate dehydrogenase/methenyl tetrahydrofolate cyclohydrolase